MYSKKNILYSVFLALISINCNDNIPLNNIPISEDYSPLYGKWRYDDFESSDDGTYHMLTEELNIYSNNRFGKLSYGAAKSIFEINDTDTVYMHVELGPVQDSGFFKIDEEIIKMTSTGRYSELMYFVIGDSLFIEDVRLYTVKRDKSKEIWTYIEEDCISSENNYPSQIVLDTSIYEFGDSGRGQITLIVHLLDSTENLYRKVIADSINYQFKDSSVLSYYEYDDSIIHNIDYKRLSESRAATYYTGNYQAYYRVE